VQRSNPMQTRIFSTLICLSYLIAPPTSFASSHQDDLEEDVSTREITGTTSEVNIVSYPRIFFEKFQPLTALDMVEQVPGFQLENNNSTRGYGNALGNLLINDRRPTAKQDQPNEILSRIPAGSVERIELIRGQVREIDLMGESNLINIVLKENDGAAIKWEAFLRRTFGFGIISPAANISITNNWAGIDYSVGLSGRRANVGRDGREDIHDGNGVLTENRVVGRNNRNTHYKGNINASKWIGETFFRFNSNLTFTNHLHKSFSNRFPADTLSIAKIQFIKRVADVPSFEIGFDMERNLNQDLFGKLIFLFYRGYDDEIETQTVTETTGNQTLLRTADTFNVTTEGISRLEFVWTGKTDHTVQLNLEGVYNLLDGKFSQTDDTGTGPVSVTIPGANSKVEEIRGDFVLRDVWSVGKFELEYGLGAEVSRITQTGDVDQKRSFFFLKPQSMVTYSPGPGKQTRLRIAREVSQLNLQDFISATVFEDNDLALGNPDIRPDTTWLAELSHERRIGRENVVKVTVFHHWISDVLDLLPLSSDFEAPGNIGDGRRWGIKLESTLPLDWTGLSGARLKLTGRWQDSSVIDPVTGENRVLSAVASNNEPRSFNVENEYVYNIDYRQDFEAARVGWGWNITERAEQPKFRVNELEIYDEGLGLSAFIETTRWFGIKINFFAENILDFADTRDRRIFSGERDLSPLQSIVLRDQIRGPRIFLTFSGTY
jgi:hypothetical protein